MSALGRFETLAEGFNRPEADILEARLSIHVGLYTADQSGWGTINATKCVIFPGYSSIRRSRVLKAARRCPITKALGVVE